MNAAIRTALLTLLVAAPLASAQSEEVSVSGTVSYVPTWSGSHEHDNGNMINHQHFRGIVRDDDDSSPIHLNAQDCRSTSLVAGDGTLLLSSGYCDAVDRDGDVWVLWWDSSGDVRTWGVVSGTGKFAGMTGGGTTTIESQHADGAFSITYDGTLEMQ